MKYIACVLSMMAVTFFQPCFAQLEKGNFMVGGSLLLNQAKSDYSDPNVSTTNRHRFSINFNPKVAYFFTKRFSAGLSIPYYYNRNSSSSSTTLYIGPVVRYYFPFGKWAIFPELSYLWGKQTFRGAEVSTNNSFAAGVGSTYFINSHVGIEGLLFYRKNQDKQEDDFTFTNTSLNFNIGLQIYLNRRKG